MWLLKSDKLLHCMAAALIVSVTYTLLQAFHHPNWGFWVGNGLAFVALLIKEAYDSLHPEKHSVEFYDVLAGLIGIFGMDLLILFQFITL